MILEEDLQAVIASIERDQEEAKAAATSAAEGAMET
jgi:hypothetical protein